MSETKDVPKIGEIAVFNKIITQEQLGECLEIQKNLQERFGIQMKIGRLIIERLYAVKRNVRAMLQAQQSAKGIISGEGIDVDIIKFTPPEHEKFMALVRPRCSQVQILECYDIQIELEKMGLVLDLGEILILKGFMPPETADQVIEKKSPEIAEDPKRLPYRFGQLSLINNFITKERLEECLNLQKELQSKGFYIRIGQIMIEKGYLSRSQVKAILKAHVHLDILAPEDAQISMIKFTPVENEDAMKRIKEKGLVPDGLIAQTEKMSEALKNAGIQKYPAEILIERGIVEQEPFSDILKGLDELHQRLESEAQNIKLRLPGEDVPTKAKDLTDADYLFGRTALYQGAVNEAQLEQCINLLQHCRQDYGMEFSLGQVMMEMFYGNQNVFKALVEAQKELKNLLDIDYPVKLIKFTPLEHNIVAKRIKEGNLVPQEKLLESLDIQIELGNQGVQKDVIEILIARKLIEPSVIADIIESQEEKIRRLQGGWEEHVKEEKPSEKAYTFDLTFDVEEGEIQEKEKTLFGYIAVETGLLSNAELSDALYVQLKLKQYGIISRLGEILVEKGFLTPNQVKNILALQRERLKGVQWAEAVDEKSLSSDDRLLRDLILKNSILDKEQVQECLYIQARVRELGINESLGQIILNKDYLDEEIIRGLTVEYKRKLKEAEEEKLAQEALPQKEVKAQPPKLARVRGGVATDKAIDRKLQRILKPAREEKLVSSQKETKVQPLKVARVRGGIVTDKTIDWKLQKRIIICFSIPIALIFIWFLGVTGLNVFQNRKEREAEKSRIEERKVISVAKKPDVCSICNGTGILVKDCSRCKGTGVIECFSDKNLRCFDGYIQVRVGNNWYYARVPTGNCPRCGGSLHCEACPGFFGDRVICSYCMGKGKRVCPTCDGKGKISSPCPTCSQR